MANFTYRIESFFGLDQSRGEGLLPPSCSPDAMNVDTSDGELMVTAGFEKYLPNPVPQVSAHPVDRICFFKGAQGTVPIAVSGGKIFTCSRGIWSEAYTYSTVPLKRRYSHLMTRIGMTDYLLIADGEHRMLKYDGETFSVFGTEEGCSDINVGSIAMFRSRLFAAGDPENPNRLYYSKLPGGTRSIEDWGPDADSPSVEGGHIEIGAAGGDSITAICAMSNQLLIFKKSSIYRLIGDRPGNFTVELIASDTTPVANTACAVFRDVIYYVTDGGLCCFNGVDASPMPDARMIKRLTEGADFSDSRVAIAGDRLFFTVKKDGETRLIEYDLTRRAYLQFGGFEACDLVSKDGALLLAVSTRYVEKWGSGGDFDGEPIEAYWKTPLTDLGDKSVIKSLRNVFLRGESNGRIRICAEAGTLTDERTVLLPESLNDAAEIPLKNEGRTIRLTVSNEIGSAFRLVGGLELEMSVRKRTE